MGIIMEIKWISFILGNKAQNLKICEQWDKIINFANLPQKSNELKKKLIFQG